MQRKKIAIVVAIILLVVVIFLALAIYLQKQQQRGLSMRAGLDAKKNTKVALPVQTFSVEGVIVHIDDKSIRIVDGEASNVLFFDVNVAADVSSKSGTKKNVADLKKDDRVLVKIDQKNSKIVSVMILN